MTLHEQEHIIGLDHSVNDLFDVLGGYLGLELLLEVWVALLAEPVGEASPKGAEGGSDG